jgi:TetR/AcrR family tetracycline transcriptional repressor
MFNLNTVEVCWTPEAIVKVFCEGGAMRLSREQVLAAALDLLDEAGLEQLTMRRLAAALGVQNGATYWHFASKQALLEAMADTLLADLTAGLDTESPWTERITELARRLRRALLSRRDGGRLFSAAFFPLPNALAYGEAVIAALGDSGLSSRDAAWAADTLTYYVVGHTIEEQLAAALPGSGHDAAARLTGAVDPQRHPHMHAALAHIPAPHHQEHFDYGLRLIVDGIRAGTEGP